MEANKVRIYLTNSKTLTDVPKTVAARTRVLIDDKDEKDVRFFEYIVDYQGNHPLLKADFEAPIRARVPENRKIIAIQRSEESLSVPSRIDKNGHTGQAGEPQVAFEAQVTDQRTFEIKPMLMNPNDWFRVEVYTSAVFQEAKLKTPADKSTGEATGGQGVYPSNSEINWSCRIAGVSCPAGLYDSLDLAKLSRANSSSAPFNPSITHSGWSIYFIILFTNFNLIFVLLLARRGRVARARPVTRMILFVFVVSLSMAIGEILASWLIDGTGLSFPWSDSPSLSLQDPVATVLVFIDLILVLLLAADAARQRSNADKPGTTPVSPESEQ